LLATSGPLGGGPSAAQVRPVVAPPQPSPRPDAEIAAAEDDLELLHRVFGPAFLDAAGRVRYIQHDKAGWQYRVDEYLRDRDGFFGVGGSYVETRDTGISELDADDEKLRRFIEPNLKVRKHKPEWREAQNIFYAWVRRAFEKQLGDGTDIPGLIKAGMSEQLRSALQQVKLDYGHAFQYGGFNPRPMKKSGAYRLGTLSDHALGRAIDIDAAHNAQIEATKWNAIMAYTDVSGVELGPLAR
jgi:hypothetical protein